MKIRSYLSVHGVLQHFRFY